MTERFLVLIKLYEFELLVFFLKEETIILPIDNNKSWTVARCKRKTCRRTCFSSRAKRFTWKQKQIKLLSNSSVIYLRTSVAPFLVLCKVFMTYKSIKVAQLASKVVLFVCGAKIVRQTASVFDILYLTRGFRIHCCFLKYFIEPFFDNGKIYIKNWQRIHKLFNVALKLTTVEMDLLVAKWQAKNKSHVSQKRNHAWKTYNCTEQLIRSR